MSATSFKDKAKINTKCLQMKGVVRGYGTLSQDCHGDNP